MTEELLNKAISINCHICELERLSRYDHINANGYWSDPISIGLLTKEEFQAILDEANEKIRERARKALEIAKQEFEAL